MSNPQTISPDRTHRKAQAAARKIALFERKHSPAHLFLLYQAAFPLALTPDLLYRLWANFQRDIDSQFLDIPWIAVSDILLSPFCQEVGEELYEIEGTVRKELLKRLQTDQRFGQRRIQELSDFLLEYIHKQLQSDDVDVRDFAQAQQWTALAYTKPEKVAHELALTFQNLGSDLAANTLQGNKSELVRMASLIETFSEPLVVAELEPLLIYARGMKNWAKGNLQQATEQLAQVMDAGKIQIAGVNLPVPDDTNIEASTAKEQQPSDPNARTFGRQEDVQDYSGRRLRGKSFLGKSLAGANFSNTDLRGADFSNAILTGANFSNARMGLQRRWVFMLAIPTLLLSVISGFIAALVGFGGWGAFLGFSLLLSSDNNLPVVDKVILSGSCAISIMYFLWLFSIMLRRKLTAPLCAGAVALLGVLLFAIGVFVPVVGVLVELPTPNSVRIASMGVAIASVLASTRFFKHEVNSKANIVATVPICSALVVASLLDANISVAIALSLMVLILAVWLIWASNRSQKLSRTLSTTFLISLVTSAVTILLVVLYSPTTDIPTVVVYALIVWLIVIFLIIPFVLAGTLSPGGASIATLGFPTAITACSLFSWLIIVAGGSSDWSFSTIIITVAFSVGTLGWAAAVIIAVTLAIIWIDADSRGISLIWMLLSTTPLVISAIVFSLLSLSRIPATGFGPIQFLLPILGGIVIAGIVVGVGIYAGWRAVNRDEQFTAVLDLAIAFTAKGGTSFRGADLTEANFTEATLKSANFSDATLTNTLWFHAQKLNTAYFKKTHLNSAKVQWLLATGLGNNQALDNLDLQGINLQHVNLADTSFINTTLQKANLRESNLSRAKLINTNLDQADLFGTCMTGAYVQNIIITERTRLRGIECQYIFTQVPTSENPDPGRVPEDHRQIFKPGEFAQLMRQRFLTLSDALLHE
ncbi:MAG: pentapeptide repeat-containing protein [Phormidesmis sp.]